MQFLIVYICLLWYTPKLTLTIMGGRDVTEGQKNEVNNLTSTKSNTMWSGILKEKYIIYNNDIIRVENTIRNLINNNNKQSKDEILKIMYTALICEYSDLMIQSLTFNFFVNNNNNFYGMKIYVEKMIDNLFFFRKLYLNVNDQLLLLSLITINIFFSNKNKLSGDNNKLIITQMINLIEYSRCKNCLISNYEYYDLNTEKFNDTKNSGYFQKLSNKFVSHYKYNIFDHPIFIDNKINESIEYMYDPKNLILYDIMITRFKDITINWNGNKNKKISDIIEKLNDNNNSNNNVNFKDILDYQVLLIKVLKDLFYFQFIQMNNKYNSNKFQEELKPFQEYITDIIPNKYPEYVSIQRIHDALMNDINNNNKSVILSKKTLSLLNQNDKVISAEINIKKDGWIMSKIITNITKHKYFNSFIQSFQLFLSESNNTFTNYIIRLENNISKTYDNDCKIIMTILRENLYLFRSLIDATQQANILIKPTNGPTSYYLSSMDNIKTNIQFIYEMFNNNNKIMNIFTPIAIYFKSINIQDYSIKQCMISKQYLLLTINLIENYEIQNDCKCLKDLKIDDPKNFNLDLFKYVLNSIEIITLDIPENVNSPANFSIKCIDDKIEYNTRTLINFKLSKLYFEIDEVIKNNLSWVVKFIPNNYLKIYNLLVLRDSEIKILLLNDLVYNNNNITLNITNVVTDYHDTINFQMLSLKLLIYNVIKKMVYFAQLIDFIIEDERNTISTNLEKLNKSIISLNTINISLQTDIIINEYFQIFDQYYNDIKENSYTDTVISLTDIIKNTHIQIFNTFKIKITENIIQSNNISSLFDMQYEFMIIQFLTNYHFFALDLEKNYIII